MLYNSNLVMYDRQTSSLWAQVTGVAIVGELVGTELNQLPSAVISWGDFKRSYPQGRVLSKATGHLRPYGRNPYAGYDRIDQPPFLFRGKLDKRLLPMERVVTITMGKTDKAYPFSLLAKRRVMEDKIEGQPLVIFYFPGTASALDQEDIATSKDVGATGVFEPILDLPALPGREQAGGRTLTFSFDGNNIVDKETGSTWNILGRAVSGPLKGKSLKRLNHIDTFWFAWAAFKPETLIAR